MTNAEARFNKALRPRKPEGSLGRTAQDVHLDSHTAPELCVSVDVKQHVYILACLLDYLLTYLHCTPVAAVHLRGFQQWSLSCHEHCYS